MTGREPGGSPWQLSVRPMSADDAQRIAAWRYSDHWSVYDLPSVQLLLNEISDYRVVVETEPEALIGFLCTGGAARIPGIDQDPALTDIGIGMDPGLVGRGSGRTFGAAVLRFLQREYPGRHPRAVVQSWNQRSLHLARRPGFVDVGALTCCQHDLRVEYRIVVKDACVLIDSALTIRLLC